MEYPEIKTEAAEKKKAEWCIPVFVVAFAAYTVFSVAATVIDFFRMVDTSIAVNWISVFVPLLVSLVLPAAIIILGLKNSRYFKDTVFLYAFLNIISAFHMIYGNNGVRNSTVNVLYIVSSLLFAFAMLIPFSEVIENIPKIKYIGSAAVVISKAIMLYIYFQPRFRNFFSIVCTVLLGVIGVCLVFFFCENKSAPACFNKYKPFGVHYRESLFILIPCVIAMALGLLSGQVKNQLSVYYFIFNYAYEFMTLYLKVFFLVIAIKSLSDKPVPEAETEITEEAEDVTVIEETEIPYEE